jgi:hypothetical protein
MEGRRGAIPDAERLAPRRPARWSEFVATQPRLAEAGRALLYQYGVGLAFLSTIRADGGPRIHPVCPVVDDHGLYAFLVPSPKREDLHRDPRYALHSYPADANEDAFYVTGRAWRVDDVDLRWAVAGQMARERDFPDPPAELVDQELFEFGIERCLHTATSGHGDPNPRHVVWRAR